MRKTVAGSSEAASRSRELWSRGQAKWLLWKCPSWGLPQTSKLMKDWKQHVVPNGKRGLFLRLGLMHQNKLAPVKVHVLQLLVAMPFVCFSIERGPLSSISIRLRACSLIVPNFVACSDVDRAKAKAESLWQNYFKYPMGWWDNRNNKVSARF